jgi:ribosomal protein S18 acetylase RimI-like enzyme
MGNVRAAGLVDRGDPYQGTYAAAFARSDIVGVVAHYWNQNLVLQSSICLETLLQAALQASGQPVGGLIGPSEQVAAARGMLGLADADARLDEVEKLYSLRLDQLTIPEKLHSEQVIGRRAEPRDLDVLTRWRIAYSLEALGEEDTEELRDRSRSVVRRFVDAEQTWVLEDQGEPVASSSFNSVIREAVQVGGVWTPPAFRRRGYGRAVVAASLLDARDEGVTTSILFTGRENVPAQKAYEALGFREIGSYRILLLREPLSGASPTSADSDVCRALHRYDAS